MAVLARGYNMYLLVRRLPVGLFCLASLFVRAPTLFGRQLIFSQRRRPLR
jgi:hypothetical protein